MKEEQIYELLEHKFKQYNSTAFIETDPICLPHQFTKLQDIEIIGFWVAMLAWGNRKSIITSGNQLLQWMDNAPHDFILHHQESDLKQFLGFKHRTFNATDTLYFIEFFKNHYKRYTSLEDAFMTDNLKKTYRMSNTEQSLIHFHNHFFHLKIHPTEPVNILPHR